MGNSTLLKEIKNVAADVIDNNGNFRTVPIGAVGKRNLSEDRLKLLQSFLALLRDTSMICDETRMYLFNKYITLKGVTDELNSKLRPGDKEINGHTTNAKVNYDRSKIQSKVGENIIQDILINNGNESALKIYAVKIAECNVLYGKSKGEDLRDYIALNLDKKALSSELDEERFNNLIVTIMPYLKSHMRAVEKSLDKESIGYFNYLVQSPALYGVDKERYDYIKELLSPTDIFDDSMVIE